MNVHGQYFSDRDRERVGLHTVGQGHNKARVVERQGSRKKEGTAVLTTLSSWSPAVLPNRWTTHSRTRQVAGSVPASGLEVDDHYYSRSRRTSDERVGARRLSLHTEEKFSIFFFWAKMVKFELQKTFPCCDDLSMEGWNRQPCRHPREG